MIVYASLATVRVLRHQLLLHLLPCRSLSSLAGRHHLSIKPSQWPTGCFTLESRVWSLQYSSSGFGGHTLELSYSLLLSTVSLLSSNSSSQHCVSSSLDTRVCALVRVCVWKSVCDCVCALASSEASVRPGHTFLGSEARQNEEGFSISSVYKGQYLLISNPWLFVCSLDRVLQFFKAHIFGVMMCTCR